MFEYLAGFGILIFCLMAGGALLNWSNNEYQRGFDNAISMKLRQKEINSEKEN